MKHLASLILFISAYYFGFSQYSENFLSYGNGAIIPTTSPSTDYIGPSAYGSYGACGTGSWSWIHANCSDESNKNDPTKSVKTNLHSGVTWSAGGGEIRSVVYDLGQRQTFNELRVFQMMSSDGKVTHIKMYTHPNTSSAPTITDGSWVAAFSETPVNDGVLNGNEVTNPTVINFSHLASRFIKIEARNTGTLGNASYTEIRELKLFNTNGGSVLPVELESFKAEQKGKQVNLFWITISEINNDYFTIEKSQDLTNYDYVDEVQGAGNSNIPLEYAATDYNPFPGISYYRLSQTDFNGNKEVLGVDKLELLGINDFEVDIYPNPAIAGSSFYLKIPFVIESDFNLLINNILGKENISDLNIINQDDHTLLLIQTEQDITPGIYFITFELGGGIISKKILIK